VFLSYAYSSAAAEADALGRALEDRGAEVLRHTWAGGESIADQVSDRISSANLVIILVKPGDEHRKWMTFETRRMLESAWSDATMRVAVVAAAVRAIPAALRSQKFVTYFPHDQVRFDQWSAPVVVGSFADQVLATYASTAPAMAIPDDELIAWRNRLVHVVGEQALTTAEVSQLRGQLEGLIDYTERRLNIDERFDPEEGVTILDQLMLAQYTDDDELTSRSYRLAQTLLSRTFPTGEGRSADVEFRFGLMAFGASDLPNAERMFRDALDHNERELGLLHPATIATKYNLALVLSESGQRGAAVNTYEEALTQARAMLGDFHPQTAAIAYNLGILDQEAGDLESARQRFGLAVDAYRHVRPEDSPQLRAAADRLAALSGSGS
jgi:tetratricopeptide (TPR) repeat protein